MHRVLFDEEVIKKGTEISEESVELHISKNVKVIETYAISGKNPNGKIYLSVYYEGTIEEFKRILRGEYYQWTEWTDWSPSYGGGMTSQIYGRSFNWFRYVETPIIIHCNDGDYSEEYEYSEYERVRKAEKPNA